jgi:hypothetical protein
LKGRALVVKGRTRECVLLLAVIFIACSPSAFGTTPDLREIGLANIISSFSRMKVVATTPSPHSPYFHPFLNQMEVRRFRRLRSDQSGDGMMVEGKRTLNFTPILNSICDNHFTAASHLNPSNAKRGPPQIKLQSVIPSPFESYTFPCNNLIAIQFMNIEIDIPSGIASLRRKQKGFD